jgi:hypothetical protein
VIEPATELRDQVDRAAAVPRGLGEAEAGPPTCYQTVTRAVRRAGYDAGRLGGDDGPLPQREAPES